ncbi:MAG TPA: amino acid permease [Gemmatimonadales bacterium]|jgi:APA family basic amino acid/polyamine antiporter
MPTELKRELGLLDTTMINVGTMIASAIFIVPATVAALVPGSGLMILVWVVGGTVSLLGALSVAELAAAYPEAGGQYPYLREAYGPMSAFLYGWANFLVINPASIAAIAVGFGRYLGFFIPLSPLAIQGVAVLSIALLTALNCLGVRLGATTQNVLTLLKMGALAALIAAAFVLAGGSAANFQPVWAPGTPGQWIGPFGVAMVGALWAYDGWIETTYVGSEIKDPGRNLPRSIILSILIVIAFYVLASVAYSYVLSPARMAGSTLVAADAAKVTLGAVGAGVVTVAILVSTLGANNGIILTAARIPYAMARGGLFFPSQGIVHPRFATPVVALLTQGVISSALALTGRYDQLFTYVVFAQFVFYALSAGAVLLLRRTAPEVARPYRTWGYPVTPVVFIAFALWLVANTIAESPRESAVGAGLILLGLPGYWYWRGAQRRGGL